MKNVKKNKLVNKANFIATKKEDKLQNMAIMSIQKKVDTLIKRPELKYMVSYLPWNQTDGQTNTAPALVGNYYYNGYIYDTCLDNAQGLDLVNNRISDKITIRSTQLKYVVGFPQPVIDTSGNLTAPQQGYTGAVRIALVMFKDSINATGVANIPQIETIFNNLYTGNQGTLSCVHPEYRHSYKILYDKVHYLDGINKFVTGGSVYLKHNHVCTYTGQSNTVGSSGKNHIFIVAYTDNPWGGPAFVMPSLSYQVIHRFTDE